jgi:hypothetical protein
MAELKEYIVTLKNYEDLDAFYDDMETPGGDLYIPDRVVGVYLRRSNSRNTHYMLTAEEAELLKQDPRVLDVSLTFADLGIIVKPMYTQTETTWNKSSTNTNSHKNWGLLRCVEGAQRSNWGSDGTASQSGTITVNAEGRNVDVVVVDGMINPDHPEYAVNSDGSGGSRVIQYNWFQHNLGSGTGTYVYTPYTGGSGEADNNHGAHVAGTACGNTQGWARRANIYNINPYGTDPNALGSSLLFDYIRAFHNAKPINPATGRRNPTICNNSWGLLYELDITLITNIYYRGAYVGGAPYTAAQLLNYGIYSSGGYAYPLARSTALDADIADAIADGIIMIGAASNYSAKIDLPTGNDYNNFFIWTSGGVNYGVNYHQGGSPSSAPNFICVGAVGTTLNETKATYSMCGPRVDIFAPGSNIMSSFNSTASFGGVNDPRNATYKIGKISGTSMASPQVTGVLACALEIYPSMNQATARNYILGYSKLSQMTDTAGSYSDLTSLQGATNRYLYYKEERASTGNTWPKQNYFVRPSTGAAWPRTRVRRT